MPGVICSTSSLLPLTACSSIIRSSPAMVVHPPYCIHRYFAVVVYLMKSLPTEVRERKCEMWSKVIAEWLDIYYSSNQYLISPSLWILVVVRRGCCCECATQDSLSSFVVLSSFSDVPSLIHWFIVNPYLLLPPLSSISVVSIVSSGNSVSHQCRWSIDLIIMYLSPLPTRGRITRSGVDSIRLVSVPSI